MIYNLLPDFFWIGPLIVALILRPVLAIALIILSIKTFRRSTLPRTTLTWTVTTAYLLLAFLFFVGLFTQYAALLSIVFTSVLLAVKKRAPQMYQESPMLYLLLDGIFLSLFVTGAGPLSLDSPL